MSTQKDGCVSSYVQLAPARRCTFLRSFVLTGHMTEFAARKKTKPITAPPGSTEVLQRLLKIATGVPWKQRGRECVSVHHQHILVTVSVCKFSM